MYIQTRIVPSGYDVGEGCRAEDVDTIPIVPGERTARNRDARTVIAPQPRLVPDGVDIGEDCRGTEIDGDAVVGSGAGERAARNRDARPVIFYP